MKTKVATCQEISELLTRLGSIMMIEDEELRSLYKTASAGHLQTIEAGLIHLEKHPKDSTRLEELLRATHSLKGDSRMLGVGDVETLTHQIEDILGAVKRGEQMLSSNLCDRLYKGIDAIRKLAHEAVTGDPANVQVFYVLADLMGAMETGAEVASPPPEPSSTINSEAPPSELTAELLQALTQQLETVETGQESVTPEPSESVTVEGYHIDTIRVEAQKLDALLTQASELNITKLRIDEQTTEIEEILALWEEWNREFVASRVALGELERHYNDIPLQSVQKFYNLAEQRLERLGALVNHLRNAAHEDTARLETVSNELESGIQTLRLLPLSNLFSLFPRMVRDLSRQQQKEINLRIEGGDIPVDKQILEEMKDPLIHIIRNAIDHGIELPAERASFGKPRTATIRLKGYRTASAISIEVIDDGRGLDLESIKRTALRRGIRTEQELATMSATDLQELIFASGFSTRAQVTEISGRGVGLDVVRANIERLKGTIQVESTPGRGCGFRFKLSTTLATTYVLIAAINQHAYAIPIESVQTTLLVSPQDIFAIEGNQTITLDGQPVSLVWLADLLELPVKAPASPTAVDSASKTQLSCIILQVGHERLGLLVDAVLDQQDIVIKTQSKLLKRVRNVSGATILGTGEVCIVLNPQDLIKSVHQASESSAIQELIEQSKAKQSVLLVDDSIPVRTQLKRILEGAGYEVTTAVDGLDGFNKLRTGQFDAVVSDVEMPNLDGFSFTAKIRQLKEYSELPIVLVTTLTKDEDKRRGIEVGADAYITKGTFDQKELLDTLRRFI
jgi:two-component system chemotaxis sensor kinase CheA